MGSSAPKSYNEECNPNYEKVLIHNKDHTRFISNDAYGHCNVIHIDHPDYDQSYKRFALPMMNSFFNNSNQKYISDK